MGAELQKELDRNPGARMLVEGYIKKLADSIEEVRLLSEKMQHYESSTEDETEMSEKLTKMGLKCLLQEQKINSLAYIWSLGCIVLEILHGVPVWMSLRTKVDSSEKYALGLFAVKGRKFDNIIAKQIHVVQRLDQILSGECLSGIKISK